MGHNYISKEVATGGMKDNLVRLDRTSDISIELEDETLLLKESSPDDFLFAPEDDIEFLEHVANYANDVQHDILSYAKELKKDFVINGTYYEHRKIEEALKVLLD
jgi:hypothetical protein